MAKTRISFYATVAKVQSDAKRHVVTLDIDPDFWDRTPELVEITGRDVECDLYAGSEVIDE